MATKNSIELARQAHKTLASMQLKKDIAGAMCKYSIFDKMDRHISNATRRYQRRLARVGA